MGIPVTIHPDVSGRPQVLSMLQRLIDHMKNHDGVRFVRFERLAVSLRIGRGHDAHRKIETIALERGDGVVRQQLGHGPMIC